MTSLLISERAKCFKVLSHPVRLTILSELSKKALNVNGLSQHLKKRQSNVSQHLQVLRENGFVLAEKEGKRRIYSLNPEYKTLVIYLMKFRL